MMATSFTGEAVGAAMAAPARRARSAEAKDVVRQALIDAGRELLLASPSTPLSLRGIARHAGYSSGVIYRYFADRDALFLAIRDSEMTNFIDGLEADFPPTGDPEERLHGIADRAFDFSRYQIAAFGMESLFLFWLDKSGPRGTGKPVHDDAPAAARIHVFFEQAVTALTSSPETGRDDATDAAPHIAVSSFMAAITGSVLLPRGSGHHDFPDGRTVMQETLAALIGRWRRGGHD